MLSAPVLAHNPAVLIATIFTTVLLFPLSYTGISLYNKYAEECCVDLQHADVPCTIPSGLMVGVQDGRS